MLIRKLTRISQLETDTSGIGIRGALEDSWQSFWRIRRMNLRPASNPLIKEGDLVSSIGTYDQRRLVNVFKSGILSGELALPANGINKVIVGTRITDGEIANIYDLASDYRLSLNVFRADGKLVRSS